MNGPAFKKLVAAHEDVRRFFGRESPLTEMLEDAIYQIRKGALGYAEGQYSAAVLKARRMHAHRNNGKLGSALYKGYMLAAKTIHAAVIEAKRSSSSLHRSKRR